MGPPAKRTNQSKQTGLNVVFVAAAVVVVLVVVVVAVAVAAVDTLRRRVASTRQAAPLFHGPCRQCVRDRGPLITPKRPLSVGVGTCVPCQKASILRRKRSGAKIWRFLLFYWCAVLPYPGVHLALLLRGAYSE